MPKKYKLILTGGGTGGHVFPLIAVVRELKKMMPAEDLEIYYIGPWDPFSGNYLKKEGVSVKYIKTGKIRRYFGLKPVLQNLADIFFRIPMGVIQAFMHLYSISPDMIFSKGGYGSFPVVLSGRLFQIPVFLHESDMISGAANSLLQRFSAEVFVSFPKTENVDRKKMLVVGNPVRSEITKGDKETAKSVFQLKGEKPPILILGGSQGSERINDLFLSALSGFLEKFEIIHQCGENNYKRVFAEANAVLTNEELKKNYHLYPFLDEEKLKHAYAAAELVISRAGAESIFEIAATGKASVFLPLPEAAQNHQVKNAYAYSSAGAAVVFEEANLSPRFFLRKIEELFSPIQQIRTMGKNALSFAKPRAGVIIASYIKEYLTQ